MLQRSAAAAASAAARPAQAPVPAISQAVIPLLEPKPPAPAVTRIPANASSGAAAIPADASGGAAAALVSATKMANQGKRQMAQMDFDGAAVTFRAAAAALAGEQQSGVLCTASKALLCRLKMDAGLWVRAEEMSVVKTP